ncbi:MAG: glycosyltransferase family 4 protein [Ginsengibacter sp.]
MKLLILTPSLTLPPLRGYEVILSKQLELLSKNHSIDLVIFIEHDDKEDKLKSIRPLCNSIFTILLPKWKSIFNAGAGFFSKEPFQVRYYTSKKMSDQVNHLLQNNEYDVVIINLIRMAQYLPQGFKKPAILNMVDPLIFNYERSLSWRPWYLRSILKLEIARLKSYEAEQVQRFSRIILIAQADIQDYKTLFKIDHLDLVSYGIDLDYFKSDIAVKRTPGMIVITGNMGYAPNEDGVVFFCKNVFPLIVKKNPAANLWLVGTNPSAKVKKLGNGKNIIITGYVDDIRYYLSRAMVSVCAIRLSVGTQTKVLEAMAMGTPVVTTSAGNHGIGGNSGTSLYVADTPAGIADGVVDLLKGNNWNEVSESGRKFVNDKFRWANSVANFEGILNKLSNEYNSQR